MQQQPQVTPFNWFDLFMMPARMQTLMLASYFGGMSSVSVSVAFGSPRRRDASHLRLVSSNNWVRKHKSTANLSLVTK